MESPFNPFTVHILESIQDGFVFLDREMCYVYVNQAAERLLLKHRDEVIGRYVWDVFPQPPESPFRVPTDEALRTGRPTHVAALNVRRGVWFDCYNYPSEHGLTIIFRDVSEQKRAEAALAESEARFRTMADAAPVMIWTAGADEAYTFFNAGWLAFTGRTLAEERGSGWAEGVHRADYERCVQTFTDAFNRRESFVREYRLRRHDGRYRWVLDHGVPLFDQAGEFAGYIGTALDIHDRQLAEERVAYLAEASEVLFSSLDYEATLRHVSQLMVPRLADWVGVELVTGEGALERVATAHVDPEKVGWALEMRRRFPSQLGAASGVGRVIRTGKPEFAPVITEEMLVAAARDEEHLAYLRKAGLNSVMIVPLQTREQPLGAIIMVWSEPNLHYTKDDLAFAQELAHRIALAIEHARLYGQTREAEERLQTLNESLEKRVQERTEKLEQKNRELQDFANTASHDLQAPLRKFRTFLGLLREELHEPTEPTRDYIQRMEASATQMSQFITDLLALSRVSTRGETFEPTDLNHAVRKVVSELEDQIKEAGGRVEVSELGTVEADPVQMRQLFQNLIGNALKFHRPGVAPVIRISSQHLDADVDGAPVEGPACRILVADNGIGFEEKYLDRIFQPFQRLHSRSMYPGTGMGLAICRRIVERHGGGLTAMSGPGEGSTFIVVLPETQNGRGDLEVVGS